MSEFKVGDEVRVIGLGDPCDGVVKEVFPSGSMEVQLRPGGTIGTVYLPCSGVKLVKRSSEAASIVLFQVGDFVEYINGHRGHVRRMTSNELEMVMADGGAWVGPKAQFRPVYPPTRLHGLLDVATPTKMVDITFDATKQVVELAARTAEVATLRKELDEAKQTITGLRETLRQQVDDQARSDSWRADVLGERDATIKELRATLGEMTVRVARLEREAKKAVRR